MGDLDIRVLYVVRRRDAEAAAAEATALEAAKKAGVDAPPDGADRVGPEYGFKVQFPDGSVRVVGRKLASRLGLHLGQCLNGFVVWTNSNG